MNELQISLTRLIGKKESVGGITFHSGDEISLKQDVSLSDFHRFLEQKVFYFEQSSTKIVFHRIGAPFDKISLRYDSSKDLLDQESSTLEQIISLIKENK